MSKTIPYTAPAIGLKIRNKRMLALSAGENIEKGWCPACGKYGMTKRGAISHLAQVHALKIGPRPRGGSQSE